MLQKYKLFFACLMLFALALPVSNFAAKPEVPKLTLSAQAVLNKPADELRLKIGVVTLGDTAEVALAENSSKMQAVIDNLEAAGLCKDDYETGQFSINPTYTPYPKNPAPDWKPSINGYEVSNSLNIHTNQLESAGKLIDVANKAGANSISDIHFGLHNPRIYWTEALSAAAANAISDAQAIAKVSGVRLVRVLSITLENTQVHSPKINAAYLARAESVSPPIEPGDVKITATVLLVYEIAND